MTAEAADYRLADVPLRARLHGIEALHRLLPAAPALAAAWAFGALDWWRPARRREALDRARTLQPSSTPGELEGLARRQLREQRMADELFWRPWLARRMELRGAEHLRPGRGQIIAALHLGPMPLLQHALALRLGRLSLSRWQPAADEPVQVGRRALYTPRKVARLEAAGVRVVPRGGSYGTLRSLLQAGETLWLAVDAPGGAPAELLGRPVRLATGIAALAADTGADVLPAHALRIGTRPVGIIGAPVDPAELTAWADATLRAHLPQAMPELTLTLGWSAHGNF